jgi:small subunit ribosomal protein S6
MKRKYEAVIVLNTRGKEDSVEKMISNIGREIEAEGAKLEQIDQLGRKKLAYEQKEIREGFFVNYMFQAEPTSLDKVRAKLKLNPDVHYQHYQRA